MQREIKIQYTDPNKEVHFVGRNGEFNQHGINLFLLADGVCLIEALRKNGQTARCLQSIPHADIPALIAGLQQLYDQHAPAPTPVPEPEQPEVDGSKPKIVLEVGKQYVNRIGEIVTIESMLHESKPKFPYFGRVDGEKHCRYYSITGQWIVDPGGALDLLVEHMPYTEKVPHNEDLPHTEPKVLMLEVVKKYRTRSGDVAIVTAEDDNADYPS